MYRLVILCAVATCALGQRISGDARLVNGSQPYDGVLQVWHQNEWRFVCDDGFGREESIVTCRSLGYYPPNPLSPICCQRVDPPSYWLDNVVCRGTEARIGDCQHRGWGNHNCGRTEGVRVRCTFRDPCGTNPCPAGNVCRRISNIRYACDTPVEPKSPPSYRISLRGVFQSVDRSVISAECTAALSREMELKAFEQIDNINTRLGSTLCRSTAGFRIIVVGSSVSTAAHQGLVNLDYIMIGGGASRYSQYFACANEVSVFLQDFNNWRRPMLPTPPGCQTVTFLRQSYSDAGRDWFC